MQACAGGTHSSGVYVDDIDRVTVKNCTGNIVASYWGKLMAEVWLEGDCANTNAAECLSCCVDKDGAEIPDCDCAAWKEQCNKEVSSRTQATAQAWLGTAIDTQTSGCTTTTWEIVNGVKQEAEVSQGDVVRSLVPHRPCAHTIVHATAVARGLRWGAQTGLLCALHELRQHRIVQSPDLSNTL